MKLSNVIPVFGALTFLMLFSSCMNDKKTISHHSEGFGLKKDEAKSAIRKLNSLLPDRPQRDFKPFESDSNLEVAEAQCLQDEFTYKDIEGEIVFPLKNSLKKRTFVLAADKVSKNISFTNWSQPKKIQFKDEDFVFKNWNIKKQAKLIGMKKLKRNLEGYLGEFEEIEDAEIVTLKVIAPKGFRDDKSDIRKAKLITRFEIRGKDKSGYRRNDRGILEIMIEKSNNQWKLLTLAHREGETVSQKKQAFREITAESGLNKIPEYQRIEAIRRGGYAIAVGDYNNDNVQDLFVGAYGPGKLLKGDGKGQFSEVKDLGLRDESFVKTAIFSDLDNDGFDELLLVRFVPNKKVKDNLKRSDIVIYKNIDGKRFKKLPSPADKSLSDYAMPASVADFNRDGLLDFYVGFPGAKDFTTVGEINKDSSLKTQGFYINQGAMKFASLNSPKKLQGQFDPHQQIYPHSSVAADFDQDGDMDILVIDDRGNLSPLYQNNGKGSFTQVAKKVNMVNKGYGMSAALGDMNNDGRLDVLMTNVNFHAFNRYEASCFTNWGVEGSLVNEGLKAYQNVGKSYVDIFNKKNGLTYPGEGLAGVEYIDYNNDGLLDIYVANGLWSGNDREQDLSSHLILANRVGGVKEMALRISKDDENKTQSFMMNLLTSFKGDIHSEKWDGKTRPSLSGFQRNRLYRNLGDGKFVEVGYLEGVDSIADGYIIAKADIDGNGAQDLILRNGDPGSEDVNFPAVQVFLNQSSKNKSLRIKLSTTSSNYNAIGAEVKVWVKGKQQVAQLIANNGTAQSEKILHFGLSGESKADVVEVSWPSGSKQRFTNVPSGLKILKENVKEVANAF
jgi:hypothetical protein